MAYINAAEDINSMRHTPAKEQPRAVNDAVFAQPATTAKAPPQGMKPEAPSPYNFNNSPIAHAMRKELQQAGISPDDPAMPEILAEAKNQLGNAPINCSPAVAQKLAQEALNGIAANGLTNAGMQSEQTIAALQRLQEQRGISPAMKQRQGQQAGPSTATAQAAPTGRRRLDQSLKATPIKKDPKTTPGAANDAPETNKEQLTCTARQDMALTA